MSSSKLRRVIPAGDEEFEQRWPRRFAGPAAFMAGIILIIALGVRVMGLLPKHDLILLTLFAVTDLLIIATLLALWRTNACGEGLAAKVGFGLAILGYLLDVPGELLTEVSRPTATTLSGVGVSLFAVGMVIAGISMLRARRWHGWHRFVPVELGAYIPLVLIPSLMFNRGPDLAFAFLGVLYILLGLAVRAEQATRGGVLPAHLT